MPAAKTFTADDETAIITHSTALRDLILKAAESDPGLNLRSVSVDREGFVLHCDGGDVPFTFDGGRVLHSVDALLQH